MASEETPLVSIIIRTHNRPIWAMEAVRSALSQTHPRTEVVLVEDGAPLCRPLLNRLNGDGRITYVALGAQYGRCVAGNEGLARARGSFINFLDDDDLLYPWHVETLLAAARHTTGAPQEPTVAYGAWEIATTKCLSLEPLRLKETRRRQTQFVPYDKIMLWIANYLPIQAVLFDRRLYDRLGGLDLTLDSFEDWELWCRYSTMAEFVFVPKVTSVFRVPHKRASRKERSARYDEGWTKARNKVDALRFEMDRFDADLFTAFAKHYAARNKYVKIGSTLARVLRVLGLIRTPPAGE